jgi:hypothetical protein
MVITTGRKEGDLRSVALGDFKTEHIAIEPERAIEVGHFQTDVANSDAGMKRSSARIRFHNFLSFR